MNVAFGTPKVRTLQQNYEIQIDVDDGLDMELSEEPTSKKEVELVYAYLHRVQFVFVVRR